MNNLPKAGHVAGDVRDDFAAAVDGWKGRGDVPSELYQLTGKLWNCSDMMPTHLCAELDLAPGYTYAQGARLIRSRRQE